MALVRTFDSGATRNLDADKLDYEGFLSPLVVRRFAEYMHAHRKQADGVLRDSDNWQRGIPQVAYMKSGFRHFMDWWMEHRGHSTPEGLENALCALIFNAQGYLHEHLSAKRIELAEGVTAIVMPDALAGDSDEDMGLKAGEAFRCSDAGEVGN